MLPSEFFMSRPSDHRLSQTEGQRFPKSLRLRKQSEFDRVYQTKCYAADQMLVVKAVSNGTAVTRLGLSISRRVGQAVVRNQWKRVIREVFRKQRFEFPTGLDLVVRPRRGANCRYDRISKSLPKLIERLNRQIHQETDRRPQVD